MAYTKTPQLSTPSGNALTVVAYKPISVYTLYSRKDETNKTEIYFQIV